ncbi:sulfurtransferase [Fulvivirga sp.]|uniref:sulfurtransferase n=1 Tax=Fulvivirga sp. TaxID=1931237 RepID=UPI0032ECC6BB
MSWKIKVIVILLLLSSCIKEKKEDPTSALSDNFETSTSYLIEATELSDFINKSGYKILDFRKREEYDIGHIEGALSIWRTDIEDNSYKYDGMMASPAQIESLFSRLGIEINDTLVIYDDNALCDAARLWWILQNYEFTKVRLVNGGLKSWTNIGGMITSETPFYSESIFRFSSKPSMKYYVSKSEVLTAIGQKAIIIDTRSVDEYAGQTQKKGAAKAGRIPGSTHIDWADAVDLDGDSKFKSIDELNNVYKQLLDKKEDEIIVYCHSGVRSAHTVFVLTQLLGFKNVKNYDGSWTEWSHFNELQFEKDSLTTINL